MASIYDLTKGSPVITGFPSRVAAPIGFSDVSTDSVLFPITGYIAYCAGTSENITESSVVALLDNKPVERTLEILNFDPVRVAVPVLVDLNISHKDPTDLQITLTSPNGTTLTLWDQGTTGGEDIIGTFPTTIKPIDSLGLVENESMNGDWVLTVEDVDVGPLVKEGTLNSWGLTVRELVSGAGPGSPITITELSGSREYSCRVAPKTGLGEYPFSGVSSITTLEDRDVDQDGILNSEDNCRDVENESQTDTDKDSIGDACDPDDDNDAVFDTEDAFQLDANESADNDGDGVGNNADAFPNEATESVDTDGDGIGNNADTDDDGDGISDQYDQFPLETNQPPLQWQRFDDLLESVKGAVNQ